MMLQGLPPIHDPQQPHTRTVLIQDPHSKPTYRLPRSTQKPREKTEIIIKNRPTAKASGSHHGKMNTRSYSGAGGDLAGRESLTC
jgi:hypothetical protein